MFRSDIVRLSLDGKQPRAIASELGCSQKWVYQVLKKNRTDRSTNDLVLELLMEVRDLKSEIRRALGIPDDIIQIKLRAIR